MDSWSLHYEEETELMLQESNRMRRSAFFLLSGGWLGRAAVAVMVLVATATATEQASFRTGPELAETLTRRVGFEISGDSRRDALQMIAKQFHVALFLDRRIDPDFPITYRTQKTPLGTALEEMVLQFNAAITWLGPIGYVGPASEVRKLQTLRALTHRQLAELPEAAGQRLLQKHRLQWDRLTTPAEIVQSIAGTYQLQWEHPERLPHDLWAGGNFPVTDCATQLTIVLAGFDCTFQFGAAGSSFALKPIPARVTISRAYALEGRERDQAIGRWKRQFPQAEVRREGQRLILTARVEDHWQVDPAQKPADTPDPKSPAASSVGRQVYTLRVEASLEAILTALARQTGLSLVWQRQAIETAGIDVKQVVRLDVNQVPLEALLRELLKPVGLVSIRKGQQLTIAPEAK
jgi:hypothetical protein